MKLKYILPFLLVLVAGCQKDLLTTDFIRQLNVPDQDIPADGTTIITITAELNPDAIASARNVIFKTSKGSFIDGKDGAITKKAEFENEKLIARVQFKAPTSIGKIIIQAEIDMPEEKRDYIVSDSITAIPSQPDKLQLFASAFGVMINFGNEITVSGTLENKEGGGVSSGNKILLEDFYVDNGTPVNGRFRDAKLSTSGTSQVSAIYSPGFIDIGKKIWIIGTVLDAAGNRTPMKDTVLIQSIQN
ncbi:hypothetical protein GFS24_20175 [Chitinophaga sp. SYP-B3965]|uniref:hypothetical protein n=1 Tax=Chitinophaga sp. SYP-B3965 TaxID=2663120 RepID=UPI00129A00B6|nr:hypothetical protein [Chitinophaga sp. SYP-B3965]MRG47449.1 hypothetical protein [Chitinophaga sp. SYP-B3965]